MKKYDIWRAFLASNPTEREALEWCLGKAGIGWMRMGGKMSVLCGYARYDKEGNLTPLTFPAPLPKGKKKKS